MSRKRRGNKEESLSGLVGYVRVAKLFCENFPINFYWIFSAFQNDALVEHMQLTLSASFANSLRAQPIFFRSYPAPIILLNNK